MITVSIVTHGHGSMVEGLLKRLLTFPEITQIILVINAPELINIPNSDNIFVINNSFSRGYGQNHNYAFKYCKGDFFCVLNPDIEFYSNPFPSLLAFIAGSGAGVVSPLIVNSHGEPEDAARRFPTVFSLAGKLLHISDDSLKPKSGQEYLSPDWIAGMFMFFSSQTFRDVNGFDERYFMYYEDADICRRLRAVQKEVRVLLSISAIHNARRDSHKKLRHFRYHLRSAIRFLFNV